MGAYFSNLSFNLKLKLNSLVVFYEEYLTKYIASVCGYYGDGTSVVIVKSRLLSKGSFLV